MKFILLFLIFNFQYFLLTAQSWQELSKDVNELYEKGKYEKAIIIAENEVGEIHPACDSGLKNLGDIYLTIAQYCKAESSMDPGKIKFRQ